MRQLEHVVTAKFEGPKWQFPSKIYSDTFLLYSGMDLPLEDLCLWNPSKGLSARITMQGSTIANIVVIKPQTGEVSDGGREAFLEGEEPTDICSAILLPVDSQPSAT